MMYEYWFAKVEGISGGKKRKLREYYKDAQTIYNIEETELNRSGFLTEKESQLLCLAKREENMEELFQRLRMQEMKFIPYFDEKYPDRLRNIMQPPYALYVRGELPKENKVNVAIVGARMCTPYGEKFALEYAKELAAQGAQIISGMARGIDGAAHRGAINGNGATFAILGCGPDICYPREHTGLYNDICVNGGVLSEYIPGTPPLPKHFPARNRLISGLADVVLVMEAKEKSGSLITADMALEQGKDVYALPGAVTSPLSTGCHHLINQGAGILISPSELLKDLRLLPEKLEQNSDKKKKELESPQDIVYSCLDLYPKGIDAIVRETGLDPRRVLRDLTSLELEGKVKEISKNQYSRR